MGGTLLVIHHSGKGATAQDYRGSSDYAAAADASFKLERDGSLGEPLTTFVLKITKTRSGSACALRGRLTDSGFFGETSRPEPEEVFPPVVPLEPEAVLRALVRVMDATEKKHISSEQAVVDLGDGRITSAKQLVDALRPLNIAPKDIRIGGRRFRGYSLEALVNCGNAARAADPRGSAEGRTCGIVENKGVSPQNEKMSKRRKVEVWIHPRIPGSWPSTTRTAQVCRCISGRISSDDNQGHRRAAPDRRHSARG